MIFEKALNSSAISAFRYDTDSSILSITFKGNRTYDYPDVPLHIVEALATAESAGKYFNTYIKQYAKKAY